MLFPPGRMVIMTTNFPERIDQTILREGRVDCLLEINYPKKEEYNQFIKFYYPEITNEQLERFNTYLKYETKNISISVLEEYIKKYKDNYNEFILFLEENKPKKRGDIEYKNPLTQAKGNYIQ